MVPPVTPTVSSDPFFGELYLRSTRPFLDPKVTVAELDYLEARL